MCAYKNKALKSFTKIKPHKDKYRNVNRDV